MKCQSSAIALALTAVALVVSLMANTPPRPDPIPLCTEQAEGQLLPALTPDDLAVRKQIKSILINICVNEALRRAGGKP